MADRTGSPGGMLGGWLYHVYAGCDGGTCLIISSPVLSVLWGVVMGGLLFSMFQKEK
ncbi:hypothetical protein [Alistipes ihumii]|uniref:hypothetical protein n=1 Tax=Alistipes ihumii TaxID=1470347 RepID=UPI002665D147|nr:hypothetical protein [Alistipes ihumii]